MSREATLRARGHRWNMGASERIFWNLVRHDRLGFRIRRQFPIGQYVIDFYCVEATLAIEIDGEIHEQRANRDEVRDCCLAEQGVLTHRIPSLVLFDSDRSAELSDHLRKVQAHCIERSGRDPGPAYRV